jgi:hypothetical protein
MTTKKTVASRSKTPVKKVTAKKSTVLAKEIGKARGKSGSMDTPKLAAKKLKKVQKKKVIRDSFTMPQNEYSKIAEIKAICLKSKMHVKKSEVLRAGLKMLAGLNAAQLKQKLGSLEKIKTGRPHKH